MGPGGDVVGGVILLAVHGGPNHVDRFCDQRQRLNRVRRPLAALFVVVLDQDDVAARERRPVDGACRAAPAQGADAVCGPPRGGALLTLVDVHGGGGVADLVAEVQRLVSTAAVLLPGCLSAAGRW